MHSQIVDQLRQKLLRHAKRVGNTSRFHEFHAALTQLWAFVDANAILASATQLLMRRFPEMKKLAAETFAEPSDDDSLPYYADTSDGQAALSAFILRECLDADKLTIGIEGIYLRFAMANDFEEQLSRFSSLFVSPLYEYLDEQLTDQRVLLSQLIRYRHKCEWFCRGELFERWQANTQSGERTLANHLYEYLHDQGVEFHIEPHTASGRPDLVADQRGDDPVILDAKVFTGTKDCIRSGIAQIHRYAVDLNQPFGYLVIFQVSGRPVRFSVPDTQQQIPLVSIDGKIIFLVLIDLLMHDAPASKRGNQSFTTITLAELLPIGGTIS